MGRLPNSAARRSLFNEPGVEPIGVVELVSAIGIVERDSHTLGAASIDRHGLWRTSAANSAALKRFLPFAVTKQVNAKDGAATAVGGIVDGDRGIKVRIHAIEPVSKPTGGVHAEAFQVLF